MHQDPGPFEVHSTAQPTELELDGKFYLSVLRNTSPSKFHLKNYGRTVIRTGTAGCDAQTLPSVLYVTTRDEKTYFTHQL